MCEKREPKLWKKLTLSEMGHFYPILGPKSRSHGSWNLLKDILSIFWDGVLLPSVWSQKLLSLFLEFSMKIFLNFQDDGIL